MATINYTAVKGSNTMGSKPFYIGIVQHGRVMSKKETYAYCAAALSSDRKTGILDLFCNNIVHSRYGCNVCN